MKTEVLEEFLTLAQFRGFNKAARQLYVSQSSLSAHIARLEKELGVQLIDREAQTFRLTKAGGVFLDHARRIVDAVNQATMETKAAAGAHIQIRLPESTYANFALSGILADLGIHAVPVAINAVTQNDFTAIADRTIDVGWSPNFSFDKALGQFVAREHIGTIPIPGIQLAIGCGNDSPLFAKGELTSRDLYGATVLMSSMPWFELERHQILDTLGEGLELSFVLDQMENETDLAFTELGNKLVICGVSSLKKRYFGRSDIRVFELLDGQPMQAPEGHLIYRLDGANREAVKLAAQEIASALETAAFETKPPAR